MTVVDDVKDRIDIVEVVGESVKLRKSGKNFTGFCPFHANTRTPAFVVFPESGTWRCFGACNEGGDVFKFVMKREGLDFPEALARLAARAGVELRRPEPGETADEQARARLREVLEAAVEFYRRQLASTPAGQKVHAYLIGRGLREPALETFEVGYAPAERHALLDHLAQKSLRPEEAVAAGVAVERESGERADRFRDRIVFPIRDARGQIAGFGGRAVDPNDVPKYLNTPQTPLFDKSRLLYGLNLARRAIRAADQAVIVEGYTDVIGLHQAGFENAVSPMGTALSEAQLRLLKRYTRRMVLALDADAAGGQAVLRGLDVARQALDRQAEPVFDPRGLIRQEGRLDADLRVVRLPPGKDPDEVVAEAKQAWTDLVQRAQPVVEYVFDALAAGRDLEDAKTKAEIARQILPLIDDVSDPVEREAYRQRVARRLRVDERALAGGASRPAGRRARRARQPQREGEAAGPEAAIPSRELAAERFCLGFLLREPELLYRVDRTFQELELERLSAADFTGTDRQVIFQSVQSGLAQDEVDPVQHWRESLPEELLDLAGNLHAEVGELELDRPRVLEEVLASFLRLRERRVASSLSHLRFQMQAAQEEGEDGLEARQAVWDLAREVQRLTPEKLRLERALGGRMAEAHAP
jgi:DNA primase